MVLGLVLGLILGAALAVVFAASAGWRRWALPLVIISQAIPVIAIAPSGPLFEKTASNLQEAAARGGQVIVFSDAEGAAKLRGIAAETVILPAVDPFVAPILYAIPVQMLAYHVAVLKGTDVDQPRNLAKSVTVE